MKEAWDSANQRIRWSIVRPIQTMFARKITPVSWMLRSHLVLIFLLSSRRIITTGRCRLRRACSRTSFERCSCGLMISTQQVQMMMNRSSIMLATLSRWPIFTARREMCSSIRARQVTMRTRWTGTTRKNCLPCRLIRALSSSRTQPKSK